MDPLEKEQTETAWHLLCVYMVLALYRPLWLASYYVEPIGNLKMLQTILLVFLVVQWIFLSPKREHYPLLLVLIVWISLTGLFADNTGRARVLVRQVIETYGFALLVFSYARVPERINRLFTIYCVYFIYIAVWGALGKGRVWWDFLLNEEDAYGPLMCMAFAFCYHYALARTGWFKRLGYLGAVFGAVGVVISFARGSFFCLLATAIYLIVRSGKVFKGVAVLAVLAILVAGSASLVFDMDVYWREIMSSSEGTSAGTGLDRKILWEVAWLEFLDYPLGGVGPYNFGIKAPAYISQVEDPGNYHGDNIYGRALHNGYMQILCELGSVGVLIFTLMIGHFFRVNWRMQREFRRRGPPWPATPPRGGPVDYLALARGLEVAMIALLTNVFFYDIIFYGWLFDLAILNLALSRCLGPAAAEVEPAPPGGEYDPFADARHA